MSVCEYLGECKSKLKADGFEIACSDPPIPQVVFYQSGIGTEDNLYSEYIEGIVFDNPQ